MKDDRHIFVIVATLAAVMVAVIAALLIGLFNPLVDNEKIFAILGPAFQTIVGCFVGLVSAKTLGPRPPP